MKNFSIRRKLIIGFLIVALIAGAVGIVGLINVRSLAGTSKKLYEENTMGVMYSGDAHTYYQRLRYNMAEMIILRDDSLRPDYVEKFNRFVNAIDADLKAYEDGIVTETDRNQFAPLKADWAEYRAFMQQAIQLTEQGRYDDVKKVLLEDADVLSGSLMDEFLALYEYNTTSAEERYVSNEELAKLSTLEMIFAVVAAVVVAIVLGMTIARMIGRPLKKMVDAADQLANGNFEIRIEADSKDETGKLARSFVHMADTLKLIVADVTQGLRSFAEGDFTVESQARGSYVGDYYPLYEAINAMQNKWVETLEQISIATEEVATGADQVSSGAQTLAAGSTEQAASVEELASTVETIAQQAEGNSAEVAAAAQTIERAAASVIAGNEHMSHLAEAMAEISSTSNKIASITKVIEDIAFQTNILALNAAIEAASAGNAGKGFAVVADEVRRLASKSAEAAKQTSELIQSSVAAVGKGAEITEQTAKILRDVGTGSNEITGSFGRIERSITEQTVAIEQIKLGLAQITDVVQTNAATAEENSATSEEMSAQAERLRAEVGKFELH